jgi:hypothetical protein
MSVFAPSDWEWRSAVHGRGPAALDFLLMRTSTALIESQVLGMGNWYRPDDWKEYYHCLDLNVLTGGYVSSTLVMTGQSPPGMFNKVDVKQHQPVLVYLGPTGGDQPRCERVLWLVTKYWFRQHGNEVTVSRRWCSFPKQGITELKSSSRGVSRTRLAFGHAAGSVRSRTQ